MQPGNRRRFDTRGRHDRSVAWQPPGSEPLPEGRHAVVRDKDFDCPCSQCNSCGGTVDLRAILWFDEWPVRAPAGGGVEEAEGERARTLHLSLTHVPFERIECSAGCEISPDDWEVVLAAAFLSLCRRYAAAADEGAAALRAAEADGA